MLLATPKEGAFCLSLKASYVSDDRNCFMTFLADERKTILKLDSNY